jgi:hypothetical protein
LRLPAPNGCASRSITKGVGPSPLQWLIPLLAILALALGGTAAMRQWRSASPV